MPEVVSSVILQEIPTFFEEACLGDQADWPLNPTDLCLLTCHWDYKCLPLSLPCKLIFQSPRVCEVNIKMRK